MSKKKNFNFNTFVTILKGHKYVHKKQNKEEQYKIISADSICAYLHFLMLWVYLFEKNVLRCIEFMNKIG